MTAGLGIEKKLAEFEAKHDDYSAIMLKALADRLAEAFAEWLHRKVRRELWGYAPDEELDAAALIREEYRGIRPAPGYPACPDHAVKAPLFDVLRAREHRDGADRELRDAAGGGGVGLLLRASRGAYFAVGKIGDDQVADLAARSGRPLDVLRRDLAPNL